MRLPRDAVMVTGGTGFVGSYLAAEFLRQGAFVVFLARSRAGTPAARRIDQVMRWHGCLSPSAYRVFDGDVASTRFGLGDEDYRQLCAAGREIWHCASETSFSPAKRELLEHVNIGGTRNVLAFANAGGAGRIHYVGTSYSVGRVAGTVSENLKPQTDFHNPYEETKHAAERLLTDACHNRGVPSVIYRPSIIIGESGTGRTLAFKGMYYPLKVLDYFRTMLHADLTHNGGENARRVGAHLDADGKLVLPLRLVTGGDLNSAINLVPIDYVVRTCLALRDHAQPGRIYHIVHRQPVTIGQFVQFVEDVMGIRGVGVATERDLIRRPETELEARFRALMAVYLPYLSDRRVFASDNAQAVLRPAGLTCPRIDQSILERCLAYATSANWAVPWSERATRPTDRVVGAQAGPRR